MKVRFEYTGIDVHPDKRQLRLLEDTVRKIGTMLGDVKANTKTGFDGDSGLRMSFNSERFDGPAVMIAYDYFNDAIVRMRNDGITESQM